MKLVACFSIFALILQLLGDWVHQFASATGMVLEAGRRVVVYSGKDDYICNYIGGEGWTNITQWKGQVREREREREGAVHSYVHM